MSSSSPLPPPASAKPGTAWVLFVTLAIQSLASAATIAPAVIGPVATQELGLSSGLIGVYMALVYMAAMATSVLGGTLVNRYGPVRCSQVALLLCGAGMALLCTGSIVLSTIGALLIGVGYGPITPASSYLLVRTTPPERMSLVFSIKQTGVPLGGVIAALLVPQVEAVFGWRWSLAVTALACVACALLAQSVRQSLDADRDPPTPFAWRDLAKPVTLVWRSPALRLMAVCSFLFSTIQLAATSYMVTYFNLSLGWTLIAAGVALSATQVAGVVGRIFWGVVADRWIAPRTVLGGLAAMMALACLGMTLLGPTTPVAIVFILAVLYGASGIGWNGVFLAEVARRAPAGMTGQATGGTLLFTYCGVFVGQPVLSSIAVAAGGSGPANYGLAYAVLCVPALASAYWLLRGRRSA